MRYNAIGSSNNIFASVIGQGSMGIGGYLKKDSTSDKKYIDALQLGINSGMTFIDTAENYGGGYSEIIIGEAVKRIRDKVLIATKVSPEHLSYENVIHACDGSLKRLGTDYIDIYQIHWPNPAIPVGETLRAMETLKKQGKIRFIGVSNFSLKQLKEAIATLESGEIVSAQVEYNLFDRTIENDILPFCEENSIAVIAYSPLDQGDIIQGESKSEIIRAIALKYNKTPAQIVLNWLISHKNVITIPKALKPEHIRQNAESANFELDSQDIEKINYTFQTAPIEVAPDKVKVVLDGQGSRKVYQTIEDAIKNDLGFTPSPEDLAKDMRRRNEAIKPVRVRKSKDITGRYEYDLVEGRIRYWAWVIAHGWNKAIPVLIRG